MLAALAVGDQAAIEREDWELFRNTGVAHLMSISGLHVTMFAWLAGPCHPRAVAAQRASHARAAGAAGGALRRAARRRGVCVVRRLGRAGAAHGVDAGDRRAAASASAVAGRGRWCCSPPQLVVSALDPWALLQPGFWLSFVAVGLLMASEPAYRDEVTAVSAPAAVTGWQRARRALIAHSKSGLRTQLVATLGLAPLTLVFFQQVSVVGLFANLVAIPVVTLLMTPLALLGVLVAPLWSAGAWVTQALSSALALLAALPGAVWTAPAAPAWAAAAGLLARRPGRVAAARPHPLARAAPRHAVAVADAPTGRPRAVSTCWPPTSGRAPRCWCARIGTRSSTTPARSIRATAMPAIGCCCRCCVHAAMTRIDRLMLSHRDTDHVGGAAALLQSVPVGELLSSLEPAHPLLAQSAQALRCDAGQAWTWDGVRFEVLHPPAADHQRALKPNALSCVLRVSDARHSALLAGDIERDQEQAIAAAHGRALKSDLLIAPHHGSRTSSTAALLDAVQPAVAVFQAGYRNRFGHPAPDVIARYRERGIAVVTSAACGAYVWRDGQGSCERERNRRYWHFPIEGRTPADLP